MSTTTRVLRNVTGFTVTKPSGSTVAVTSIMECRLNDATGELRTGSDNDAAYSKFASAAEYNGELILEDPLQGQPVALLGGCNIAFQAIDIRNGNNVNVTATGTRFGQVGLSAAYGQQGRPSVTMSGGLITYVAS